MLFGPWSNNSDTVYYLDSALGYGKKSSGSPDHMQSLFDQPAASWWRQHESVDSRLTKVINEVKVLNRCEKSRKQEGLKWLKRDAVKRGWKDISLDKFVINCTLLRIWTPPGSSFKRTEVLAVTLRFGMGQAAHASTSGWQHQGQNWDFLSLKHFSWHLYELLLLPTVAPSTFLAVSPKLFSVQPQISYSHLLFPNPTPQQQWNLNAKQLCCAVVFRCMALWKC